MREASIRAAEAADAPALAALVTDLGYPSAPAQMPGRLTRLAAGGRAAAFVAESEAGLVGLVTVHLMSCIHADAELAQLTALVVAERARGTGVGRSLVIAAETWARARGATRMHVTTALHRAGAHLFYERLGYEHTGKRYVRTIERPRGDG